MHKVTLYGKRDCTLCDEAKKVLSAVRLEQPFELEEVDIAQDPELEREYGERIPLIWVDERLAFKYYVNADELRSRLSCETPESPRFCDG